jgi:hypothetical protein
MIPSDEERWCVVIPSRREAASLGDAIQMKRWRRWSHVSLMRIREDEDAGAVLVQDEEQKPTMVKCKE